MQYCCGLLTESIIARYSAERQALLTLGIYSNLRVSGSVRAVHVVLAIGARYVAAARVVVYRLLVEQLRLREGIRRGVDAMKKSANTGGNAVVFSAK